MAIFTGGDAVIKRISQIQRAAGAFAEVRVGFLAGSTDSNGMSNPQKAADNEYGTGHIPPRPFFRNMIKAKSPNWGQQVAKIFKANGFDSKKTLLLMGALIKRQLQEQITNEANPPPNAPLTILKKGFDKPLIDTSDMVKSVDYEV